MFLRLAILFVSIPLIEVYLLLRLNEFTGNAFTTIGLILLTGIVGAWLAKQQGLSTVQRIQKATSEGRLPAQELVDGGMILFAAALLLTPGIMTDAFGFSLLIPPCRAFYRKILKRYFPQPNVQFHAGPFGQMGQGGGASEPYDPNVVDGSARSVNDPRHVNTLELENDDQ